MRIGSNLKKGGLTALSVLSLHGASLRRHEVICYNSPFSPQNNVL